MTKTPGPTVFVLFGATGDLARRMVLPAFYTLAIEGLLPSEWILVGNGRGDVSHENFRQHVREALEEFGPKPAQGPWKEFSSRLRFAGGGFNSDDPGSLLDVIAEARSQLGGSPQLVHYLAIPPVAFEETTKALGEHGLASGARVVFEKPFGTSPASFRSLNRLVHRVLGEEQVYRIDHFLGKEATQNLHVARFANEALSAVWNRDHIESVQIDVPETLGVEQRAAFYDATGAVLDMLVTHLFQVAAEVAMEPPASLGSADLQAARERVIRAFRPLDPAEVVLGQHTGYKQIKGVERGSATDTYVAAKLWIDNARWRGVPFLLRTGKRLAESRQVVSLVLRTPAGPFAALPPQSNVLTFDLAGDGTIDQSLLVKRPGVATELEPASVRLPLDNVSNGEPLPPYARLIHDVLLGDRALFTRPDGLSATWKTIEPLLSDRPKPSSYAPGSWGPAAARRLAAPHRWLLGQ
ncbi:glucose-6-phosphate dehydrogenase [Paractinoplanes brasiliensis]|uniref:Glucose-6-phosphate 1-dehydrogenase n=1 Tax=Paractinoplanes brasiliensis TaxID=52695 RepID=A0A4R6JYH2_9ACTN|nr:glucose-6-phosphate dehydrogenase (NADP(+)) [Actinoplanes brasiliensis]TDO40982.1 glucose-6-phosphate 1-dehydrogenase [Actinoplanes brasiliensis]